MSIAQEIAVVNGKPTWTEKQRAVIEAPAGARIVVVAGPGTGKTAVACARVAHLADQGVNASSILMFSFTRAAVAELRNRIKEWAHNPEVAAVKITTLDSAAWFFRYGAGQDAEDLPDSFEKNIAQCVELLRTGSPVLDEYLEATSHLIIDESQDLTGIRAELVAELIKHVPANCGITVFGDPAQSIYVFTSDQEDDSRIDNSTFLNSFPFKANGFVEVDLDKNHRTDSVEILALFNSARQAVYPGLPDASQRPPHVHLVIRTLGKAIGGDVKKSDIDDGDLVLYRRRAQALHDAEFYEYAFRLRMSNMPTCIHPWVAAVFADFTSERSIDHATFKSLWNEQVDAVVSNTITRERAWELLDRHARGARGRIDLVKLRRLLCRSRPHADFCLPEYGMWGPIFGTIHASKGREADRVVLMLPRKADSAVVSADEPDADRRNAEEARVYYVGATRARKRFQYSDAASLIGATSVESGRVFHPPYNRSGSPQAKVQFGQSNDLDETALVRRDISPDPRSALAQYRELIRTCHHFLNCDDQPIPVCAKLIAISRPGTTEWRYRIGVNHDEFDPNLALGWLNPRVGTDLFYVGNYLQEKMRCSELKPPTEIKHLKILGLRTIAVDPTSNDADRLHEPFASSGFLLAPLVFGFPTVFFQYKNRRR